MLRRHGLETLLALDSMFEGPRFPKEEGATPL